MRLLIEYFYPGWWPTADSYQDICLVVLASDSCPETLNLIVTIIEHKTTETLLSYMATSPPLLPCPSEKFTAIHHTTPVVQAVPPCFIADDYVTPFPLHNGL